MLRALAAGWALGAGLSFVGLVGADTEIPAPFDWTAIITGAATSSATSGVLIWQLNKSERARAASDKRNEDLVEKLLAALPLMADSTRALKEAQDGMRALIDRSHPGDADQVISRLRSVLDSVERRGDR